MGSRVSAAIMVGTVLVAADGEVMWLFRPCLQVWTLEFMVVLSMEAIVPSLYLLLAKARHRAAKYVGHSPMQSTTPRLVFTLGVLLAINTMNFFDRQILAGVQESIRKEWGLSDSQLGYLGTAFILVYAAIGVPLGRLADLWRRKWILAIGVGVWSLLTFASGLAWNFWSLFVMRLGVGVGEASCAPAANSLIGDLVPADRRARALAVFMLGLPLGLGLSLIVSGTVAKHRGWQEAFYVAGVPGLLLAGLACFILEPARGGASPGMGTTSVHLPFVAVARQLLGLPTLWWIIASGALHNFNMYALGQFLVSMLIRYHGLDIAQAGRIAGMIFGVGALGIFAAGWLGDRAFRLRGARGRLNIAWIALAAAVPCLLLGLAAPAGNVWMCAIWLLLAYMLMYTYYGTVYATIQDIVEPTLRGTAMAIYFCAMYFLGAVLGPVATGWVSDYFARQAAERDQAATVAEAHKAIGLHDALYLVPALGVVLVVVLFAASRTVRGDYERLQKRLEGVPVKAVTTD
jgi:MFS family permease